LLLHVWRQEPGSVGGFCSRAGDKRTSPLRIALRLNEVDEKVLLGLCRPYDATIL